MPRVVEADGPTVAVQFVASIAGKVDDAANAIGILTATTVAAVIGNIRWVASRKVTGTRHSQYGCDHQKSCEGVHVSSLVLSVQSGEHFYCACCSESNVFMSAVN